MASKPRNYQAGQPVAVGIRFILQICLFDHRLLRHLFIKLLAHWAVRARVQIWAFAIQTNHAHLILSQDEDGCPALVGIAAFMRNVVSRTAKVANRLLGSKGRVTEETYWSVNIETLAELVRQLAYIHYQNEHHAPGGGSVVYESSAPVYYELEIDGVVTRMPVLPLLPAHLSLAERQARLVEILDAVATEALRLEALGRQAADPTTPDLDPDEHVQAQHPWLNATEAIAPDMLRPASMEHPSTNVELIDLAAHPGFRAAREAWTNWPMPAIRTPRREGATRIGGMIDIRIHTVPCAHCAPLPGEQAEVPPGGPD